MDIITVEEIYNSFYGSQDFYRRSYYKHLIYTEGIKEFQHRLNAYWLIEFIISNLTKIFKISKSVDDGFFIVKISVEDSNNTVIIEIYREGYVNNKYDEHITVFSQYIPEIDLPKYDYKFYLIWSGVKPIQYTLLLPNEY
jgi:hypothetical protein